MLGLFRSVSVGQLGQFREQSGRSSRDKYSRHDTVHYPMLYRIALRTEA